jgi:nitroreductase
MHTLEAIHARRSVKHYDADHKLSQDEERALLEAAIQAPTSFNVQHWRLVVLRDPALRHQIKEQYCNQAQITDASLLVLFTADIKSWAKEPQRYWRNAPEEVAANMVKHLGPFHENRGETYQRDEAHWSVGMAMQNLMLAAQAMGYRSCPMIGYDMQGVAGLVKLPEDHIMGPIVAVGKGTKEPWPKPGQLPLNEVVRDNSF